MKQPSFSVVTCRINRSNIKWASLNFNNTSNSFWKGLNYCGWKCFINSTYQSAVLTIMHLVAVLQVIGCLWGDLLVLLSCLFTILTGLSPSPPPGGALTYAPLYPPLHPSTQELVALGLSNVAGGLFQCFSVTSSMSRSLIQESTGGRTQVRHILTISVLPWAWFWSLVMCMPTASQAINWFSNHLYMFHRHVCCLMCTFESVGGCCQVAGAISALVVLIAVLKLGPLFEKLPKVSLSSLPIMHLIWTIAVANAFFSSIYLPQAVLSTVVFVNLKGMFKQCQDIPMLWRSSKPDLVWGKYAYQPPLIGQKHIWELQFVLICIRL